MQGVAELLSVSECFKRFLISPRHMFICRQAAFQTSFLSYPTSLPTACGKQENGDSLHDVSDTRHTETLFPRSDVPLHLTVNTQNNDLGTPRMSRRRR